jgi:hypothetical protein
MLLKKGSIPCSYLSYRTRVGWLEVVVYDLREIKLNRRMQKKIAKNGKSVTKEGQDYYRTAGTMLQS